MTDGRLESVGEPRELDVKPVPGSALPAPDFQAVAAFQEETRELMRRVLGALRELGQAEERIRHLRPALVETPGAEPEHFARLEKIEADLAALKLRLAGDRIRGRWNEPSVPSIQTRVSEVAYGHWDTRQAPTATQRRSLALAREQFEAARAELLAITETELVRLEEELDQAGAPWTPR